MPRSPGEISGKLVRQVCATLMFVCLLSPALRAQVYYSVNPNYLKAKTEGNNIIRAYRNAYPDTSITLFHNFFPRNFLGNIGLPSAPYILKYGTTDLGFKVYPVPLENDMFSESQVTYYRSAGPFASLTGIAGAKELQIFKMLFSHTFKQKVNVTLRFNRYTSTGYYVKQQTYSDNFFLSSNSTTTRKNAGYYLYFLSNSNKNAENGGIKGDSITDKTLFLNKDLLPVNLHGATRSNKEMKLMINPWVRLSGSDSVNTASHYLQLKSKVSRNIYHYKDTRVREDDFYDLVYLDTVTTNDSTHLRQMSNEINYVFRSKREGVAFSGGYRNELNDFWQKTDSVFFNHLVTGAFVYRKVFDEKDSVQKKPLLQNDFGFQQVFKGANTGDFKIEDRLSFYPDQNSQTVFYADLLNESRHPDHIYNYWVSNHFMWQNSGYSPQQQLQLRAGCMLGRILEGSVFVQNISNYLYFDQNALPRQMNDNVQNLGVSVNFNKIFFKHLGVGIGHIYQATSHPAYVRLPRNISTTRLHYHGMHFRNNLQVQVGAQLQLYESFYAYDYMPATQTFYLQENFKTALYPFLDAYINVRIRPVNVFLKLENVLQGYAGNNYAFVPGYYQPDRAFRCGISWMFFD